MFYFSYARKLRYLLRSNDIQVQPRDGVDFLYAFELQER